MKRGGRAEHEEAVHDERVVQVDEEGDLDVERQRGEIELLQLGSGHLELLEALANRQIGVVHLSAQPYGKLTDDRPQQLLHVRHDLQSRAHGARPLGLHVQNAAHLYHTIQYNTTIRSSSNMDHKRARTSKTALEKKLPRQPFFTCEGSMFDEDRIQ